MWKKKGPVLSPGSKHNFARCSCARLLYNSTVIASWLQPFSRPIVKLSPHSVFCVSADHTDQNHHIIWQPTAEQRQNFLRSETTRTPDSFSIWLALVGPRHALPVRNKCQRSQNFCQSPSKCHRVWECVCRCCSAAFTVCLVLSCRERCQSSLERRGRAPRLNMAATHTHTRTQTHKYTHSISSYSIVVRAVVDTMHSLAPSQRNDEREAERSCSGSSVDYYHRQCFLVPASLTSLWVLFGFGNAGWTTEAI